MNKILFAVLVALFFMAPAINAFAPSPAKGMVKPTTKLNAFAPKLGEKTFEPVIMPQEYGFAVGSVIASMGAYSFHGLDYLIAPHLLYLGLLLAVQTSRVRFIFGPDSFYTRVVDKEIGNKELLKESRGNWVYGTKNEWKYSDITKVQYLPFKQFPLICVFWDKKTNPGYSSPHFFPVMTDPKGLTDTWDERVPEN